MTLKQLIKLEDNANEVWVISPSLHYDVENKEFTELVSVNLNQKTKYRYIVPATSEIDKHIDTYKKLYQLSDADVRDNFLILAESDFNPFILEIGIYNGSADCIACAAPATEDSDDVIQFNEKTSKTMAKHFKLLWKKYKQFDL